MGPESEKFYLHSWLTLQVPSDLTVTIARQPGPPQLLVPGSLGSPLPSKAMFHIKPVCELCSIEPARMKLCCQILVTVTSEREVKREVRTYAASS